MSDKSGLNDGDAARQLKKVMARREGISSHGNRYLKAVLSSMQESNKKKH